MLMQLSKVYSTLNVILFKWHEFLKVFIKGTISLLLITIWYNFYHLYCYGNGVGWRQRAFVFLSKTIRFRIIIMASQES